MIEIGLVRYTPADKIIEIRDKDQVIKAKYCLDQDNAEQYELMKEHYIELSFPYNKYVAFKRSACIVVGDVEYYLREDHIPDQENKYKYKYTLKFEAVEMLFQDIQYYYRNQGLKEIEWSLTATPDYFMQIGLKNINSYFGYEKFVLGTIEPTKSIFLTFSKDSNVFDSLTQIAEELEAEWYLTGNTLHLLNKVSFGDEVEFEVEKSILSMSRTDGDSDKQITRLLALGSTRNLTSNYRKTEAGEAVDAIYQKRLRIPISKGDVIDAKPKMSPTEVIEGSVVFDDVYPKRVGTIEAVGTIGKTDTNSETGEVTNWDAYKIKDSGLVFKEEYELPGVELRLIFTSGNLNGFDFALEFHSSGFSDEDDSQYFEIQRNDDYGTNLPNTILKPSVGDEYVLYGFNIDLVSDQYVPSAEEELYEVASKWLANNQKDTSVYDCQSSIGYFQENQMILEIGQRVKLIHEHFDGGYRSSRIMGYKKNLLNPYNTTYIVGDNATYSRLSNIETDIKQLQVSGLTVSGTKVGNGVYLIKQFDSTAPSDFNAYSAKASNAKFFNKQTGDVVQGNSVFNKNLKVNGTAISSTFQNETFTTGAFGSGFQVKVADNGQSYAEFDNLHVRREMVVETLTIADINSVDGGLLITCANMKCIDVEELENGYKCYFDSDEGTIPNRFKVEDQAISKIYEGKGTKYYWRLVTEIGDDYIVLSKTDVDGSGIPAKNDKIVQFGHRTDTKRQTAQLISSYGDISSGIYRFDNVDSYDLTGKTTSYSNAEETQIKGNFIIQSTGKSVTDTINDIQIGGRNYLRQNNYTIKDYITNNITLPAGDYIATCYNCRFDNIYINGSGYALSNKFTLTGPTEVTIYADWGSYTPVPPNQIKCKIEQGNKATDWSPSPEDVEQRITKTEATFEVLSDKIESKVSNEEFSTLDGRLSSAESNITQLSDSITSTVEKVDKKNSTYTSTTSLEDDHPQVPYVMNDLWIKKDGSIYRASKSRVDGGFIMSDWIKATDTINDIQIGGRNYLRQNNYTIKDYITNNVTLPAGDYIATCYNCRFDNIYINGSGYAFSNKFTLTEPTEVTIYADWGSYTPVPPNQIKCKIEQGNKATDWSPSPEDVEAGITSAQDTADSKVRTFYSEGYPAIPSGGFKEGDIWYRIGLVDGCYETYRVTNGAWIRINVNVSKTRIEQTDESIKSIVESTNIDEFGIGRELKSLIDQTAKEINLSVTSIQIGGRNYLRQNNYTIKDYITNNVTLPAGDYIATCYNCRFDNIYINGSGYAFSNKFTLTEPTEVTIYADWGSYTPVPPNQIKCKIEQGNKATDWSPSPEDVPEIVGSELSITDNKISLASNTIELTGNTIAKSIATSELDVGNGNFHVGTDGKISAKGANIQGKIESNSNGNRIVIDSEDRSVQVINQSGVVLGKWYFYDFGRGFTPRIDFFAVDEAGNNLSSLNIVPDTIQMTTPGGYYMSLNASGISFVKGSKLFSVSVDITKSTLQLNLKDLPASKTGLRSGAVWRDGEYLKIVP